MARRKKSSSILAQLVAALKKRKTTKRKTTKRRTTKRRTCKKSHRRRKTKGASPKSTPISRRRKVKARRKKLL